MSDDYMPPTAVRIASMDNMIAGLLRQLAEKRKERSKLVAKLHREKQAAAESVKDGK